MKIEDLLALLIAELEDDVVGSVTREGNGLTVRFADGTERKIIVM